MSQPAKCKRRGCDRRPDPESYYDRCHVHMWCDHCGVQEVRTGRVCDTCRRFEQRNDGRRRPVDLIELQRRRLAEDLE